MTGRPSAKACCYLAVLTAVLLALALFALLPIVMYVDIFGIYHLNAQGGGFGVFGGIVLLTASNALYIATAAVALQAIGRARATLRQLRDGSAPEPERPFLRWGLWVLLSGFAALSVYAYLLGPAPVRGYGVAHALAAVTLLVALTRVFLSCAAAGDGD